MAQRHGSPLASLLLPEWCDWDEEEQIEAPATRASCVADIYLSANTLQSIRGRCGVAALNEALRAAKFIDAATAATHLQNGVPPLRLQFKAHLARHCLCAFGMMVG